MCSFIKLLAVNCEIIKFWIYLFKVHIMIFYNVTVYFCKLTDNIAHYKDYLFVRAINMHTCNEIMFIVSLTRKLTSSL